MRPAVAFPAPPESAVEQRGLPVGTDLVVTGLRFGYPAGRPVLDGIDLNIPAGTHLAVAGPSGCGKSTLLALLARVADPDAGAITLGGRSLPSLTERELRERVALVPQHPHVFDASLAENLRIAAPQASEAELWQALETVRLASWIRGLPAELETRAGAFGAALSGGQARRLAIARALLCATPVLLLDEPTEGLDSRTEAEMIGLLRNAMAGRTLVVVTHRPAVAKAMDRVLRLGEAAASVAPAKVCRSETA